MPYYFHHLAPNHGVAAICADTKIKFQGERRATGHIQNCHGFLVKVDELHFVLEKEPNIRRRCGLIQ